MSKPLVIIFITCANVPERSNYAIRTIDSVFKNLITPDGFSWYICDDGSPEWHHTAVRERIKEHGGHICGHHNQKLGYGGGVNKAWPISSQTGPVTLWLEDDWELNFNYDVSKYIELLNNNESIGMIRMGHIPIGQSGMSVGHSGNMYLSLSKENQYYYSGNPHLKHDRFMLEYGPFPEGLDPGDTEINFDHAVRNRESNLSVLWPMSIGDRFIFGHIGEVQSYDK